MRQGDRLHSLDAVRAFALLAGIVLHASWAFLPGLAETDWRLADHSSSVVLGVLFHTIHSFRMPLFFLIAGFFARMLLTQRGVAGFIRNRALRILVPLVIGWIVLYPLVWMAFAWPVMKSNGYVLPPAPSFFNRRWSFPLAHLWFLYYLLLMYATALGARWVFLYFADRRGALRSHLDDWMTLSMKGRWATVLLAFPSACSLFMNAEWYAWFGVATPDRSLRPTVPSTVAFGTAFILGWLINRQTALLRYWQQRWAGHLVFAILLTALSLMMIGLRPTYTAAPHEARTFVYAICTMTACWNWTFAVIGLSLTYCSQPSAWRRYLADASYWMYLVHLPIVLLMQAAMQDLPWHWSVKLTLNLCVTMTVLLLTYHYFVRDSVIGVLLNGRRHAKAGLASTPINQPGTATARS